MLWSYSKAYVGEGGILGEGKSNLAADMAASRKHPDVDAFFGFFSCSERARDPALLRHGFVACL